MLRRIESARRRSLTKLVAPISADAGGEGLDLFGAPLADSDEEADARPEEASRAALVQARALPIALAIVAHMAWLRAHNASLLIAKFPRAEWRSQDPEGADTESSDPTPQMVRRASARRCAGAGCLARARAGLPRSPAVSGRGMGRCAACRADELQTQCAADLSRLLSAVPMARQILRPDPPGTRPPPTHEEVAALLRRHGYHAPRATLICAALVGLGVPHLQSGPRPPTAGARSRGPGRRTPN